MVAGSQTLDLRDPAFLRALVRPAWLSVAAISLTMSLAGLPYRYNELVASNTFVSNGLIFGSATTGVWLALCAELLVVFAFAATATLLFWHRSDDPLVLIASSMLMLVGTMNHIFVGSPWALADHVSSLEIPAQALSAAGLVSLVLFIYLFPRPEPLTSPILLSAPFYLAGSILVALRQEGDPLLGSERSMLAHPVAIIMLTLLIGIAAYRFVQHDERSPHLSTQWVSLGLIVCLAALLEASFISSVFPTEINSMQAVAVVRLTATAVAFASFLIVPICFAVAVTRHQLFRIDIAINRTLVYLALTLAVAGAYAVIVGLLTFFFQTRGSFATSLIAAGIVAVGFQAVRERIQRGVDRLMYGERNDPYGVLVSLGHSIDGAEDPNAVLNALTELVGQALKLQYTDIVVTDGNRERIVAMFRRTHDTAIAEGNRLTTIPLLYGDETVGILRIQPRRGERRFADDDLMLLDSLTKQATLAVQALRMRQALHRSRELIVQSREEERQRLRRTLHDELGPSLASISQRLGVALQVHAVEPERLQDLLSHSQTELRGVIGEMRNLAYNLRPPALDEFGLAVAIRDECERLAAASHDLDIQVAGDLPELSPAVEVAAFRIALEAIANAVRHAEASWIGLHLSVEQLGPDHPRYLRVEVSDNGVGFDPERSIGVGIASMRERATELGGTLSIEASPSGVQVLATLPIQTVRRP